jgi:uncharacterized protein DUF1569
VKNLFDPALAAEVKSRISRLHGSSERQWGKMSASQAMAHCAIALELAIGDKHEPRKLIGRVFGAFVKGKALGDDAPIRRNTPTLQSLVITDERDLDSEKARLSALIDRFAAAGPAGVTAHPHSFFGRMTAQEWAILMYKHLDHHLRQFGA